MDSVEQVSAERFPTDAELLFNVCCGRFTFYAVPLKYVLL